MGCNGHDFSGAKNPNFKTGYASRGKRKSFYNSWCNIRQKCNNPNNPKYHRYGGRGITICKEWDTIQGFAKWALSNGWKEGMTIDRIDNNGNYCPENCKWVSLSENSRKKSTTKLTRAQAEEIREKAKNGDNWHDIAKEYNVTHGNVWFIIKEYTHVDKGECTKKLKQRNLNK